MWDKYREVAIVYQMSAECRVQNVERRTFFHSTLYVLRSTLLLQISLHTFHETVQLLCKLSPKYFLFFEQVVDTMHVLFLSLPQDENTEQHI